MPYYKLISIALCYVIEATEKVHTVYFHFYKVLEKIKLKEQKPDLWLTRVKSREKVFRISSRKNL